MSGIPNKAVTALAHRSSTGDSETRKLCLLADDILNNVEYDILRLIFNKFPSVFIYPRNGNLLLSGGELKSEAF
ncbi:hypothetical protein PanWU01x14_055750 [Parasponia andersonii]|uniref:Uncharacterized protein n=1 Tax=Parasponia andersonii TaxID=3476 RepID=A0A2P5DK57_PARAD|nr:hypothetical protein PanWU01x14_055750 [Parasponia andersonii]